MLSMDLMIQGLLERQTNAKKHVAENKDMRESFEKRRRFNQEQIKKHNMKTYFFDHTLDDIIINIHQCPYKKPEDLILHNHKFFEFLYIHQGSCLNLMRKQNLQMQTGDAILLNPDTLHAPFAPKETDYLINVIIKQSVFDSVMMALLADNKLFSNFFINYLFHINKASSYL